MSRLLASGLIFLGLLRSPAIQAEDIDLYSSLSGTGAVPNVLIVMDNAANFSSSTSSTCVISGTATALSGTVGGIEQCALYNVIQALPDSTINIGLMSYNANNMRDINGSNCGGSNGGCLNVPLMLMNSSNKASLLTWIRSWVTTGGVSSGYIKASGEATGATMQEAWAYYHGKTGLSGRDYAGVAPTVGCQKNFVIFIGNSYSSSGSPADGGSTSPQAALEGTASPSGANADPAASTTQKAKILTSYTTSCGSFTFPSSAHDTKGYYADEWARYMYQSTTQSITSYTIGVLGASCQADYAALLTSMANNAGGKYFPTTDYAGLVTAIGKILNEVQAINSVFSSSSLPVSVNTQGTYLNQVYMGMFRPDQSAAPRWYGNLKQYQFLYDANTQTLNLGDSEGNLAISSAGTGFISPDAVSFWTKKDLTAAPDSTGGFWKNASNGSGGAYDSPDGELVEKGGVAQQLRLANLSDNYSSSPSSPRNLYTYCPSGAACSAQLSNSANAFATTNTAITNTLLGTISGVTVSSLTRSGTTATAATASAHGFSTGNSVTISGATQSEYNGTFTVTVTDTTHFTYTVPEYPPTTATGTFTASMTSSPQAVTSITRSGTTATVTLAGHGYVTGQTISISGANQTEYNKAATITVTDANHFTYTVTENPPTTAGGGTATVGASTVNIASVGAGGVSRTTGSTTVTVTTTNNHGFSTGNTVTLSGVTDSSGNPISQYNTSFTLTACGNSCKKVFYITLPSLSPVSPATGTIVADSGGIRNITSLTRSGTTATATSAGHGFANGQTVNIGGTPGTNEDAYVGSFVISGVTANTFNYTVTVTPTSPATGTISAAIGGTDRVTLINWVRGEDNQGDEASPGGYTVRPSIHGDVLHSRPAVINYGGSTGVVVFYGSNDGVFRAINGNQTAAIGTTAAGGELWGFLPTEFYTKLKRLRDNSPQLKFASTPGGIVPTPQTKDYMADGPTGVYQRVDSSGSTTTAYIYMAMRRGGRLLYALDVTTPTNPQFLWKKTNSSTDFSELGQTWSQPKIAVAKGYTDGSGNPKPLLIFGAGYDPAEDSQPPTADTMGRGIYIVDAVTGDVVWSAGPVSTAAGCSGTTTKATCQVTGMNYSIPADITLMDRDNDGYVDRLYAADVGGNIWRVDLQPTAGMTPDKWQVTKLAALGCSTGTCASGTTPRKFLFGPDIISGSTYDAILAGSGDREHPIYETASGTAYNVTNRFYMIKDTHTGNDASGTTTVTESALIDETSNTVAITATSDSGTTRTATASTTDIAKIGTTGATRNMVFANGDVCQVTVANATTFTYSASSCGDSGSQTTTAAYDGSGSGFYHTLGTGEKVVNAPTTVAGFTFFGTNSPQVPASNSCDTSLGTARGYRVNPFFASSGSTVFDGGGLPPTPVSGFVTINTGTTSSPVNVTLPFCIGCGSGGDTSCTGPDCTSSLGGGKPPLDISTARTRVYWYELID